MLVSLGTAMALYTALSLMRSPGHVYGSQKAVLFVCLNLWLLVLAALVIGRRELRLLRLGMGLFLAAAVATIAVIASGTTSGGGTASVLGVEYGVVGKVVALGALLGLAYLVMFRGHILTRVAVGLATLGMTYTLFTGGLRQTLLGAALASVILFLAARRRGEGKPGGHPAMRLAFVFLVFAGILVPSIDPELSSTLVRLELLVDSPREDTSTTDRIERYQDAWRIWAASPVFGHGTGSWPVLAGYGDVREYPHNLFLELGAEQGLLGVLLFVAAVAYAFAALGPWSDLRRDPIRLTILMLLTFALVTSQVSGDLVDNRILFLLIGLAGPARNLQISRRHISTPGESEARTPLGARPW
jgi:O-antigen ligase